MSKPTSSSDLMLTDNEIIELFFARDQVAITATENKYRRYLYSVSYNILKDPQDSEECINDLYLALWNSIPPQRPSSFKGYMTVLIRRTATNLHRKKKRQRRIPDEMETSLSELDFLLNSGDSTEQTVEANQLTRSIDHFLGEIGKEERALFVSRYYLCLSIEDIARAMGTNKKIVYRKLDHIRKKLKDQLKKEGFLL